MESSVPNSESKSEQRAVESAVDIGPDIEKLCSAEEIDTLYQELCLKEETLEGDLERTLEKRCELGIRMTSLQKLAPSMQFMHADAKQLSGMIEFTSQLARTVSAKVRQLDTAKTRVAATQQRVNDMLDLKLCADGVRTALCEENYEQAAAHVHRFLCIDESAARLCAGDSEADSLTESVAMLSRAEARLLSVVHERFQQAVKASDAASIERFFKIFPLLNKHEDGIQMFSNYLSDKLDAVANKSRQEAASTGAGESRAAVVWADSATVLFETIARLVELHQPIIETFYGPGWLMTAVKMLQISCDKHLELIMDGFRQARQLSFKVQRVNECLRSADAQTDDSSSPDPRDLDPLLTEMSVFNARAELYTRFVRRRVMNDIEVGFFENERSAKVEQLESIISNSSLNRLMQDLISNYITLESYYMTQCIAKAVKLDAVEEDSLTSSMVDDVLFIVKKCVRRSLSGCSVDGACAMINIATNQLETQLAGVLERHLRLGFPSGYLDLSQAYSVLQTSIQQGKLASMSDADLQKRQFLTALNNSRAGSQYLQQLCDELARGWAAGPGAARDHQKLDSCLAGLRAVCGRLDALTETGLKQLRSSAVRPRVKPWVDAFGNSSRDLSDAEFARYEADDPFVNALIGRLDGLVGSLTGLLLPDIGQALNQSVLQEVAVQLEKAMLKCCYNRLGGLQLDKEVRTLVTYLSSITTWAERDRLARLSQISTLLNLEQVAEVHELWGPGSSISWKLSPAEVRRVMSLRVDFKSGDVRRLKL